MKFIYQCGTAVSPEKLVSFIRLNNVHLHKCFRETDFSIKDELVCFHRLPLYKCINEVFVIFCSLSTVYDIKGRCLTLEEDRKCVFPWFLQRLLICHLPMQ